MREMSSRGPFVWTWLAPALLIAVMGSAMAAEPGAAREGHVTIVPLCSEHTRLIATDVTGKGPSVDIAATCIDDATGRSTTVNVIVSPGFDSGSAVLHSVFSLELTGEATTQVALAPSGETLTVRTNNRTCVAITATERRPSVPTRFLGQDRNWSRSVDYMVDGACRVIAVRLGNRVAIATRSSGAAFELYGVYFNISPKEATP